jgi:DNA polymerase III epsilon subunit family exonuclease
MASLLSSLWDVPLAFVDVETTGISWRYGHRVIEVAVLRIEDGVATEYQQLIDPQREFWPGITALTGITPQMVRGQPKFAEQIEMLIEFLRGAVVVGHNIDFDLSFLGGEFERAGRPMTAALADASSARTHVLDTVRIARRRFGRGGNSLLPLSQRLGIEPNGAHRALADARTTAALLKRLLAPVGGLQLTLADAIGIQGGPIGLP